MIYIINLHGHLITIVNTHLNNAKPIDLSWDSYLSEIYGDYDNNDNGNDINISYDASNDNHKLKQQHRKFSELWNNNTRYLKHNYDMYHVNTRVKIHTIDWKYLVI